MKFLFPLSVFLDAGKDDSQARYNSEPKFRPWSQTCPKVILDRLS